MEFGIQAGSLEGLGFSWAFEIKFVFLLGFKV